METPVRDQAETLLLRAGRLHGINAKSEEVRRALDDAEHGPAFAEWAASHLSSENLLSPDELALYAALDANGQVDRLAALHDLADVQPVSEDDVRAAIEDLQRSTTSIAKQTHTLRQQQDALSRLVKKSKEGSVRRREMDRARLKNRTTDQKVLAAEVDSLTQGLEFRVTDLAQQGEYAGKGLADTVAGILQADDKLLSSLQKLSRELDQQDPGEARNIEKLRETCMRLIKTTVETVRTKLDMVYLEAVAAANETPGESRRVTVEEVREIEEEVESLYSEILPVAQMAVEQQHLEPALKSVKAQSGNGVHRSAAAVTYINECLDYLLDRMQLVRDRVEAHNSHQTAAGSVISTAKAEMAVPISPPPRHAEPALPASPVRPRRRTGPGSPRRHARRSSGLPQEPPLETLLHALALPLPDEVDAATGDTSASKEHLALLARTTAERARKCKDVARNTHESFETGTMAQLEDARAAIQLLRDSLLAESPFGDVKLVDPEIEGSILVLGQELESVRQKLGEVERKGSGPAVRSEKKEELIQRWGR